MLKDIYNRKGRSDMRYRQFIKKLTILRDEAKAYYYNRPQCGEDSEFRYWKQRLESLIREMEREGYSRVSSDIPIRNRSFSDIGSTVEKTNSYNRNLEDTINDIDITIKRYNNYGKPRKNPPYENLISLIWNSTLNVKIQSVIALVVSFLLGVGSSLSSSFRELFFSVFDAHFGTNLTGIFQDVEC